MMNNFVIQLSTTWKEIKKNSRRTGKMSDEEIIEVVSALKANDKTMKDSGISDNLWGKAVECIMFLQSENAALRERFLPCKVGDYVYDIANGTAYKTRVLEWRIFDNGHIACRTISSFPSLEEFGTRIFLKKEAAEASLAELKGDK